MGSSDTATFLWVADSAAAGKLLAVRSGVYGYEETEAFRVYDRGTAGLLEKHLYPAVIGGGGAGRTGQVQWAFWKSGGSGYYVVFVAGGLTGIATY